VLKGKLKIKAARLATDNDVRNDVLLLSLLAAVTGAATILEFKTFCWSPFSHLGKSRYS